VPLRVVPLGGLGEVGMNCLAIEVDEGGPIVVVDCGVTFPDGPRGIDVFHPDLRWLAARRDRIAGLLVTHGHEDHIGAIPFFARAVGPVPVYGPPYALALVRERLAEHANLPHARLRDLPPLLPTTPRRPFAVGTDFEVEPIRVTHSIADATALVVRTGLGTVLHTGDFKIDPDPLDGEPFDVARFTELGREGVDLLLSDSTSIDLVGTSRSERAVAAALERLIVDAPARVVVTLFASNVHRLRALAAIAGQTRRKLVLLGRGVSTHVRAATDTGYLAIPPELLASVEQAANLPREQVLVVATGSQGEPRAALARLALDDHPLLRLAPGDRVLLSARAIPGNERGVMRMIGDLHRRGCDVRMWATDPDIHASGHAYRDEQRRMIDLCAPRAFVPVHGNRHHLERHAALAREAGVESVVVVENGEVVELEQGRVEKAGTVPSGMIATFDGLPIAPEVLDERRRLGEVGVVFAHVVVDAEGRAVATPSIAVRGLPRATEQGIADEVVATLETHPFSETTTETVAEVVRQAARRGAARETGQKPVAVPIVVRERGDAT